MARTTTTLADGFFYLEGLRWHDDWLWASDMLGGAVHRFAEDGKSEVVVEVDGDPSGLGWLPDGRLLVVSMRDRRIMRLDGDVLVEHASLAHLPGYKLNDMFVDPGGRAWVGDYGFDLDTWVTEKGQVGLMGPGTPPTTFLARVDPDGSVHVAAEGLEFPNGVGLLPDGKTLVVAQSVGMNLLAFDVGADGRLDNRRVWAPTMLPALRATMRQDGVAGRFSRWVTRRSESGPAAGLAARMAFSPDGICVDAEGAVWVANARSPEVLCIGKGGRVLERVRTSQNAYSCTLGGHDGTTLYVATAPTFVQEQARRLPLGAIEAIEVDAPAVSAGPPSGPPATPPDDRPARSLSDWEMGPPTGSFTIG
jgi:sugar lactone lactonase YvrE